MSATIVVTVLVENSVHTRGLMAEHGLAFHIQAESESLLFDTGQSGLAVRNAVRLEVDLARLRSIALSHGHYDHTGGLQAVWQLAPEAELIAHPSVGMTRFTLNPDGIPREVGMSQMNLQAIQDHACQSRFTSKPTEVLKGIFLTGEIPRETDFEDVGGAFVLEPASARPDPILDDQALFFDTPQGLTVLLGCAHAGVVNTLRYVRHLAGGRPIHQVIGGMHLQNSSPERMARTVEALRQLGVAQLSPAHCTGMAATGRFWGELQAACLPCSVGSRFVFQAID